MSSRVAAGHGDATPAGRARNKHMTVSVIICTNPYLEVVSNCSTQLLLLSSGLRKLTLPPPARGRTSTLRPFPHDPLARRSIFWSPPFHPSIARTDPYFGYAVWLRLLEGSTACNKYAAAGYLL
eukprot:1316929-Pleurochrysis_carterae.AAC.2